MVSVSPHSHGAADVDPSDATHQDDGVGMRVVDWVRQAYCGLHGHDNLLHFEKDRMFLECVSCGRQSPGWELSEARPIVTVRGEPRHHTVMRPHLADVRRIA